MVGAGARTGPHSDDVLFVAREGSWAGLLGAAGAACRYLNSIILTRVLGAGAYGLYALANTVVTLLAMPANLGLPVSAVHFVAAAEGTRTWSTLRFVVRTSLRLVVVSCLAWTVIVWFGAGWASRALFDKPGLAVPLAGLALALPLLGVNAVASGSLQGLGRIREKVFLERIAHPVAFTVLLAAGGFWFRSVPYVVGCFLVASCAVMLLGLAALRRGLRAIPPAEPDAVNALRPVLAFATPVMFLNLLNYLILWSDVLVMGIYRSAAEVGVYHVASRLGVSVNLPTEALNSSLAPRYASLHGRGDKPNLSRTFQASTRWIFTLSALVFLVLAFGGRLILPVFGSGFGQGYAAVCLLAAGQLSSAAMGTNGMLLTMTGHPQINLVNAVCLGLGNLGLNFVLVPRYGATGAAASAALSLALVNVARSVEIWWLFRIVAWNRTMLKPLAAFGLAVAGGLAATWALGPLPGLAAALVLYAATWWLLRPEPEDLDLVTRALAKLKW